MTPPPQKKKKKKKISKENITSLTTAQIHLFLKLKIAPNVLYDFV